MHTPLYPYLYDLNLDLNLNLNLDLKPRHDKMDPEWKERIARHGYGINITTALKEDLEEYMETKIYKYIYENFTDHTLWLLF